MLLLAFSSEHRCALLVWCRLFALVSFSLCNSVKNLMTLISGSAGTAAIQARSCSRAFAVWNHSYSSNQCEKKCITTVLVPSQTVWKHSSVSWCEKVSNAEVSRDKLDSFSWIRHSGESSYAPQYPAEPHLDWYCDWWLEDVFMHQLSGAFLRRAIYKYEIGKCSYMMDFWFLQPLL